MVATLAEGVRVLADSQNAKALGERPRDRESLSIAACHEQQRLASVPRAAARAPACDSGRGRPGIFGHVDVSGHVAHLATFSIG
jgi:hypothetical protein